MTSRLVRAGMLLTVLFSGTRPASPVPTHWLHRRKAAETPTQDDQSPGAQPQDAQSKDAPSKDGPPADEGAGADLPDVALPSRDSTGRARAPPRASDEGRAQGPGRARGSQVVKAKTELVAEAKVAISRADGTVEDSVRERLIAIQDERNELFDKYSAVLDAWEEKGGDAAAIAEYRAYRSAISLEETRKGRLQDAGGPAQWLG